MGSSIQTRCYGRQAADNSNEVVDGANRGWLLCHASNLPVGPLLRRVRSGAKVCMHVYVTVFPDVRSQKYETV